MHTLETLSLESESLGIKVSWIKAKIQNFTSLFDGNVYFLPPVTVTGEHASSVYSFVYLGSAFVAGGDLSGKSIDAW